MRVYNPQTDMTLLPGLLRTLAEIRKRRNFDPQRYIAEKSSLLNGYLAANRLSGVVVGLSGGIDSAVVLGLAARTRSMQESALKTVVAAILPVYSPDGATNQQQALDRATLAASAFGIRPTVIDLTRAHEQMRREADPAMGIDGNGWASGQLVSYIRTPALYYAASLLTASGSPALVLGTTNRDEGSYLGYFGKASDGMTDLQLISDIHKSEVYAVAETLGVPGEIRRAIPSGDMYDGRPDTEVFGAPYDFVELYMAWLNMTGNERQAQESAWSGAEKTQFRGLSDRLEHLHAYNAHKYFTGNPSVHLDVYERPVRGGWS